MSRNRILAIVTALSVSACLYACGSDDDTNPGGAGASGHAGKGGAGGKGGSGGTAGKPASGGSGNEAGESSAGEGGTDAGGAGGDVNVGGDSGIAGAGGEGGAAPSGPTLAEACAAACTPAHSLVACATTQDACVTACTSYTQIVTDSALAADVTKNLNDYYLAAIACMGTNLTTTDKYVCAVQPQPVVNAWSPIPATTCEDAICKWTCYDVDFGTSSVDEAVYTRCCP